MHPVTLPGRAVILREFQPADTGPAAGIFGDDRCCAPPILVTAASLTVRPGGM